MKTLDKGLVDIFVLFLLYIDDANLNCNDFV